MFNTELNGAYLCGVDLRGLNLSRIKDGKNVLTHLAGPLHLRRHDNLAPRIHPTCTDSIDQRAAERR